MTLSDHIARATPRVMPVEALSPHPLNAQIYGDEADEELMWQIGRLGIIQPLLITTGGTIISGHRRLDAARRLGMAEVPVLMTDLADEIELEELVIQSNKHRRHSNEQMVREYQHLKLLESRRTEARVAAQAAAPTASGADGVVEADLAAEPVILVDDQVHRADDVLDAQAPRGGDKPPTAAEVRRAAAAKVGKGAGTLEKGVKVVEHIDELQTQNRFEEAAQLREVLNDRSVNAAWKAVQGPPPESEEKPVPKKPPVSRMKKVAEGLEDWVIAHGEHSPHRVVMEEAIVALRRALEAWEGPGLPGDAPVEAPAEPAEG